MLFCLFSLQGNTNRIIDRHDPSVSIDQLRNEILATFEGFPDPFSNLTTTYMQDQTIEELFKPVEPEEVIISQTLCRVKRGSSRVLTSGATVQGFPVIRTDQPSRFGTQVIRGSADKKKSCALT